MMCWFAAILSALDDKIANNTAVLSVIGLLLSLIAIFVSIRTARLPYKKNIKLSSSPVIGLSKNFTTGEVSNEIIGISVNVANVGSRNISTRRTVWKTQLQPLSGNARCGLTIKGIACLLLLRVVRNFRTTAFSSSSPAHWSVT
ncbi:MAG: hypothetical protein LBU99_07485 [Spirochaetaceae bacterium]|jgi:hypothetical protein|nr:hypothetical protein [Spirochaetaceae bacterium]